MTVNEFAALTDDTGLSPELSALWRDRQNQWDAAHTAAQAAGNRDGDWVHAYLHRKEGDPSNAAYWYRRAGRPVAKGTLDEEWTAIARELLARGEPAE